MSEYYQASGPVEPDGGKTAAKVATGCGLGCLGLAIAVFVLIYMGMKGIQGKVDELAENATSEPIQFDPPNVPAEESDQIVRDFDNFRNALASSKRVEPYTLSEQQINVLINHHRALTPIAGKAQVRIIDNQIVSEMSMRPEDIPMKIPFISRAFAGKYINGTATVDISIKNGLARMYLRKFRFAEWEIPPEMMKQIEGENLFKDYQSDPDLKELIDKIEELKIEGDTLYIVPKNPEPALRDAP